MAIAPTLRTPYPEDDVEPAASRDTLLTGKAFTLLSPARAERSVRSYLAHSIAATCTVLAIPAAILWLCSQPSVQLPLGIPAFLVVGSTVLGAAVGSKLWEGTPGAEDISFSELMLWSWYRLVHADERLAAFRIEAAKVDASPEEQLAVLQELSDTLETTDPYTRGHSSRVECHAVQTASAMGLSLREIDVLRKAASMHDVGKIRIPNRVLHKNGPLDDDERALIEEHPVLGAWMVSTIGDEQIVATVRHHHERWNGGGYPDGIAGEEIPLFSRIIAVADTFDAITSTRSYRAGSTRQKAIDVLRAESGAQFDPDVVEAFLATLPERRTALATLLMVAPEFLWRHLVSWLRRFGSGTVAPGVGALGAVVVLGAATFVAAPAVPQSPAPRAQTTTPQAEIGPNNTRSPKVLGTRIERSSAKAKTKPDKKGVDRSARRDAKPRSNRDRTTAAAKPARGGKSQQSSPSKTTTSAAPTPAAPALPNDALDAIQDPKKRKGQDCAGLGEASRGFDLHCN